VLYFIFRQVLGLALLMGRTSSTKDVELLVLRHAGGGRRVEWLRRSSSGRSTSPWRAGVMASDRCAWASGRSTFAPLNCPRAHQLLGRGDVLDGEDIGHGGRLAGRTRHRASLRP
jgi:hypothetical protein